MKITVALTATVTYEVGPGSFGCVGDPRDVTYEEARQMTEQEARRFINAPYKLLRMDGVTVTGAGQVAEWDPELPTDWDRVRDYLAAGLRWLFTTEQPEGANASNGGPGARIAGTNRSVQFYPRCGQHRQAGLGFYVANEARVSTDVLRRLPEGSMARVIELVESLGHHVTESWGGDGACGGSLAMATPLHPTLAAAVDFYSAGCALHPDKRVFCGCDSWRASYRKLIAPTWPTPAEVTA